ncbi:MAG: hypothetical protein D4R73_09720 [Deltaproteobacteria bacterium]|nr:MAG: hypothetical protein D4R73_09720 [Deltaproteobacteria bacterium]
MHIPSVPPEVAEQIRAAMKRPEGTFMFNYQFDGLFDPALGRGVLLEVATGAILFRLERDPDLHLHFIHSSPGQAPAPESQAPTWGRLKVVWL